MVLLQMRRGPATAALSAMKKCIEGSLGHTALQEDDQQGDIQHG